MTDPQGDSTTDQAQTLQEKTSKYQYQQQHQAYYHQRHHCYHCTTDQAQILRDNKSNVMTTIIMVILINLIIIKLTIFNLIIIKVIIIAIIIVIILLHICTTQFNVFFFFICQNVSNYPRPC